MSSKTISPIDQSIFIDTKYSYRLMLADGRPALGVIGGGHAQPFTPQEIQQIAAHAVKCWNAFAFGKQPAAAPPAVESLTRDQIDAVWNGMGSFTDRQSDYRLFARAAIAKFCEVNGITQGEP